MPTPSSAQLVVERMWNGTPATTGERGIVSFTLNAVGIAVEMTFPFHDDPAPTVAPSRLENLWEYEVVELFLANEDGYYLELEFGPHGHFLALLFAGIRQPSPREIALSFHSARSGGQWQGRAHIASSSLPANLTRANAFAIHGQGGNRHYLAAFPLPGPRPDFHQPHRFPRW